jgi:type I restriction enzyme S subunit
MKLKPYPKYKDLGIQGIGKIPEGWEVRKVKHLSINLDEKRVPLSADVRKEGEIPYYGATGVLDYVQDYLFNETLLLVGEDGAPFFDKTKSVAYIIKGKSWVNNHAHVLRINKNLEISWLCYYLNTIDYSRYIKGSTRDKLNQDELSNIIVITPPLSDQTAIANFLDKQTAKINVWIEKDRRLIELLKEKRTALIDHAVTKGLDPNVKLKDSGIVWMGEIPEGWDIDRMKFLVSKINSGITPSGGARVYTDEGVPLLRSQNIHFDGLRLDNVARIPEAVHVTMLNAVVKKHDVLINITGASIGRCTFVEDEFEKANVNQHVCILRPKKVFYKYLSYYLMSRLGQDQVFSVQMGTSREGLNFEQIGNFMIFHPEIEKQKEAVEYLDKASSKIDITIQKIEEKVKLLEEYKKSLIHYVVTGKVDVSKSEV